MSGIEMTKVILNDVSQDGKYTEFVVEPLERGFGNTLGNSLRRVLLSSLPGSAVSAIKIEGVTHEFSVIPGVMEDVVEIVLNIKGVVAKLEGCDSKTVYLEAEGPAKVTAGMISTDSDITILNSDKLIATLESDAHLKMEIVFTRGIGYVSAEQNRSLMPSVLNVIPIDSIYSPVLKANYKIENTRIGQVTDYDKLIIQVWTNGVLSASEAISFASSELIDHFNLFCALNDGVKPDRPNKKSSVPISESINDIILDDLGFSVRAYNSLKRAGINNLGELMKMTVSEIVSIRNLGKKSCEEVINKMKSFGWSENA